MGSIANEAIRRAALSSRVASRLVAAPVFVASLAPSSSSSFSSAPLPRPRVETLSGRSSSRVASSLARKRLFVFSSPNPTNYSAPLATHAATQRKPASQPLGEVWLAGWLAELPAGSIYLTAALSPASSSSAAGFIGTKSSWPLGGRALPPPPWRRRRRCRRRCPTKASRDGQPVCAQLARRSGRSLGGARSPRSELAKARPAPSSLLGPQSRRPALGLEWEAAQWRGLRERARAKSCRAHYYCCHRRRCRRPQRQPRLPHCLPVRPSAFRRQQQQHRLLFNIDRRLLSSARLVARSRSSSSSGSRRGDCGLVWRMIASAR